MSRTAAPTVAPVSGGVTAPRGFRAGAVHCGIKASSADLDLAVLATDTPVPAAALWTTHGQAAAPVLVSRQHLEASGGRAQAVVVNSGLANACTGPEGFTHAKLMTAEAVAAFGCSRDEVLVASTGVIGVTLPLSPVLAGVRQALGTLSRSGGAAAARAIMMDDRCPNEHAVAVQTSRGSFKVGGMANGFETTEPNTATLLGFLTTDAWVAPTLLQQALQLAVCATFEAIRTDRESSMSDSVFAFASGASGVIVDDDETYLALVEGLFAVSRELAVVYGKPVPRGTSVSSR